MIDFLGNSESLQFFGQLVLAAFLGALLGIEREAARKTAGMRTFALVATGSALFSIVSLHPFLTYGTTVVAGANLTQIASQIVTGVGFIGAGIIFSGKSGVSGITTAAGLWLAAAIGMSVGFGFYLLSVFATSLALFIFVVLWWVEEKLFKKGQPRRSS